MSGYEIIWNEVSSTTIPEFVCELVKRPLFGAHRGSFVDIPGRPGSWYFGEQRGRKAITIQCYILAASFPTERGSVLAQVADWLDVGEEARLQISDRPGVYYNAVLVSDSFVDEWRHLGKFELTFMCEPYSYDVDASEEIFNQNTFTSNEWTHNFDLLTPVYPVIEITNNGGVNLEGFFFTINDDQVWYTGTLNVGQTITISSISQVVLAGSNHDEFLTGVYEVEDMLMGDLMPNSTFPVLMPGSNSFEIETEQNVDVEVKVRYRKAYRS